MENNTLKYCLYYNGEEISPYNLGTPENSFWYLERQYWTTPSFNNKESHKLFEGMASKYISEHPNEKNFMTSDAPLPQKGFVMFAEEMLAKWCPLDEHIIFEYGKKNTGLIKEYCLYYKGEDRNPYSPQEMYYSYWEFEYMWVNMIFGSRLDYEYISEFTMDFPKFYEDEPTKRIPLSLKSFLYAQHCQRGGSKEGFENFMKMYLGAIP